MYDRLISSGGVSNSYNPDGLRIQSGGNSHAIDPNAGLSQVLARVKNETTTRYVWGLGLLYEEDSSGNIKTYHTNYRGSTVALSNNSSTVTDRWEYSSYGTVTHRTGTSDTPFQFHGGLGCMTDSNGLVYMRARYYNPRTMRFLNADPIGFAGGMNWYSFVGNNPISFVDPFGLCPDQMVTSGAMNPFPGTISENDPVIRMMKGYLYNGPTGMVKSSPPLSFYYQGKGYVDQISYARSSTDGFWAGMERYEQAKRDATSAHLTSPEFGGEVLFGLIVAPLLNITAEGAAINRLPVPANLPRSIFGPKQVIHTPGPTAIAGRSLLSADAQVLLDGVHAGKFPIIRMTPRGEPIIDFGKPIGTYGVTGAPTQYGIIHFGGKGAHIVPANPVQF